MARVFPTGKCFCGCGETTERTSYFVPGHDKRAEAKVVKEVYGSVVELLAAHGYGPEGRDLTAAIWEGTNASGLQLIEEWSKEDHFHVVLEVLNLEDRSGPRQRVKSFHVEFSPNDRAVFFERCLSNSPDKSAMLLTVPLPDIGWVYLERNPHSSHDAPVPVARLRGAIVADPAPRFLSFG
jgi:hypothetical protein